jgi:hypothetical protein
MYMLSYFVSSSSKVSKHSKQTLPELTKAKPKHIYASFDAISSKVAEIHT